MEDFNKTFIKPDGTHVSMGRSTNDFLTTLAWIDFVGESFQNVESGRGRWRNWQRS